MGGVDLRTVPGFVTGRYGGLTLAGGPDAFAIPCRDVEGRIVGLQLRHDRPEAGTKYVFLSSSKHGGPSSAYACHVPLHRGPVEEVRITEGFLKADIATALSGGLVLVLRPHLMNEVQRVTVEAGSSLVVAPTGLGSSPTAPQGPRQVQRFGVGRQRQGDHEQTADLGDG